MEGFMEQVACGSVGFFPLLWERQTGVMTCDREEWEESEESQRQRGTEMSGAECLPWAHGEASKHVAAEDGGEVREPKWKTALKKSDYRAFA